MYNSSLEINPLNVEKLIIMELDGKYVISRRTYDKHFLDEDKMAQEQESYVSLSDQ